MAAWQLVQHLGKATFIFVKMQNIIGGVDGSAFKNSLCIDFNWESIVSASAVRWDHSQLSLFLYLSLCRIGGLRDKLNRSNLTDVSFMIVNEREAQSRAMYWELKRRAPPGVPVYQQAPFQDDVWEALDGDKDDFLVYDR